MVTRLHALAIVALLIALVGGLPGIAAPAKAAPRTVRVATHDIEPFVMSHDNLKSGFTIDILDQIAKH
ncbi:MAG: ABC transporter substrate-binding protein, partial [Mycobacterium sp.]|nr:ABC transporter substrate-binding protein [Mycobacterium sp.]